MKRRKFKEDVEKGSDAVKRGKRGGSPRKTDTPP
jgi:hypothetical protein